LKLNLAQSNCRVITARLNSATSCSRRFFSRTDNRVARAARQLRLSGVFAAAITPTRPGTSEVEYTGLLDLLDFLAAGGVTGICLMGSTGEFVNHSFTDRQRAVYLGSKRTRVPLIVGVGNSTLGGCLHLAQEAVLAGADALLLMPPYFFPYQQREIEAFYREFARETAGVVPVMLYNIPQFTSGISIETVGRLLDSGLFAGIKDSSGDWPYFQELLALKRERDFVLFAGNDRLAAQAFTSGANGVLSGCACAIPELLVAICRAAAGSDPSRTAQLQAGLNEFIDRIERFPTPVGIKRAVAIRGQKSGDTSVPLAPETSQALEEFATWFKGWWTAVLATCGF
jgi:4-hydroxy-tetrahydrodipicolinate synthase